MEAKKAEEKARREQIRLNYQRRKLLEQVLMSGTFNSSSLDVVLNLSFSHATLQLISLFAHFFRGLPAVPLQTGQSS